MRKTRVKLLRKEFNKTIGSMADNNVNLWRQFKKEYLNARRR